MSLTYHLKLGFKDMGAKRSVSCGSLEKLENIIDFSNFLGKNAGFSYIFLPNAEKFSKIILKKMDTLWGVVAPPGHPLQVLRFVHLKNHFSHRGDENHCVGNVELIYCLGGATTHPPLGPEPLNFRCLWSDF